MYHTLGPGTYKAHAHPIMTNASECCERRRGGQLYPATASLEHHIYCGVGTTCFSLHSFFCLRSVNHRPQLAIVNVSKCVELPCHGCCVLTTRNKYQNELASTQQQKAIPTAHHFCSLCASGNKTILHTPDGASHRSWSYLFSRVARR